jgi:glycosyltransferase involved in cell wall biosynthesis
MKLTIITVVYNNIKTLEDSINSIISQTYFDKIQYIVIDGGSTDGTLELLQKYSKYIDILISEKDNGIYDAMNKGISLASGDVVGLLNSDDVYFNPEIISSVMSKFYNNNLDILYGDLVYVKRDDINKVVRTWKSTNYYDSFFEDGNVPPHPTLFIKKHVYNIVGNFNLDFKLAADYEFMLRVFKKYNFNILYFPHIIVRMRLGGTTNKNLINILKGNFEIFDAWKHNSYIVPQGLFFKRFIKRLIQFF